MRFERATEVAAASFDPESDHVEHLPLLDVAEVDRPAGLPAPCRPRRARLRGRFDQFLRRRVPREARRVDGEEACGSLGPLLSESLRFGRQHGGAIWRALALEASCETAGKPKGPFHLATPHRLEASRVFARKSRRRAP